MQAGALALCGCHTSGRDCSPSLFGELDEAELDRIKSFVAAAEARDIRIILSPHNFGRYFLNGNETLIGTAGVSIDAFADFSYKVAKAFAGDDAIYALSLMNEPHNSNGMWKQTAQAGLDAIRRADRERLVLAPGDQWSGAWSWPEYNDDFLLNDASNNIMYEAHQYFDIDHSGTYKEGHTLVDASPEPRRRVGPSFCRLAQTAPRERDHHRVRRSQRRPAVARTDAATARLFGTGEHPLDLLGRWAVVGRLPAFSGTEERRRCADHGRADERLWALGEQMSPLRRASFSPNPNLRKLLHRKPK